MIHKRFFYVVIIFLLFGLVVSPSVIYPKTNAAQPFDIVGWETGPYPPAAFQYARHDGAFVPGPALEPWANKVYFPGGRTSPPTESPDIWMFDPISRTYTDTGANVVEDVSNYNANLILDDGTGRGPAIYVIGGTNKDGGGVSIGMVQRYYPMTNLAEALPNADNWNGMVGGSRVAAMGTAVVNDVIYVYGGWETNAPPYFSAQTWSFDPKFPSGSRWTNLGINMSVPRSYIMSAVQDGKIYSIGGVGSYVGGELDPVNTVEVLDPTNLANGWVVLAPMPNPGGEGRAFGFDSDTLRINSPYQGKIYVVAPNDWSAVSGEVLEYDVATNTWDNTLPELPTPRADLAGAFIPICTSDFIDGLPGIWTFGGRVNDSCDPPLGPTEYAPMSCESICQGLTGVTIFGPEMLAIGEVGSFTTTVEPITATVPVNLDWSNGDTGAATSYSWDIEGTYTVTITASNCDDSIVVTDTLTVEVYNPCTPLTGAEINGPAEVLVGQPADYSAVLLPPDASLPIDITWDNGATGPQATYTWYTIGAQTITITATNCGGPILAMIDVQVVAYQQFIPVLIRNHAR